MTTWRIVFTAQAAKDAKKLRRSGLKPKAEALLRSSGTILSIASSL